MADLKAVILTGGGQAGEGGGGKGGQSQAGTGGKGEGE